MIEHPHFYDELNITPIQFAEVVKSAPVLKGPIIGHVAEFKLREKLINDIRIHSCAKIPDYDKQKGDLLVDYMGKIFTIEVKSLALASIKIINTGKRRGISKILKKDRSINPAYLAYENKLLPACPNYSARALCSATDKRIVTFNDGSELEIINLEFGQFDILAINLFGITGKKWDFIYCLNKNLPAVTGNKYTDYQKSKLIKTTMGITWPTVTPPFVGDIFQLFDQLTEDRGDVVNVVKTNDLIGATE